MFNKISSWTRKEAEDSDVGPVLMHLAGTPNEWIGEKYVTDEEKNNYPDYKTTGGLLRNQYLWKDASIKWSQLPRRERELVISMPNFDKKIFKEITGIDVDEKI